MVQNFFTYFNFYFLLNCVIEFVWTLSQWFLMRKLFFFIVDYNQGLTLEPKYSEIPYYIKF